MRRSLFLFTVLCAPLLGHSQVPKENYELDIDLTQMCSEEEVKQSCAALPKEVLPLDLNLLFGTPVSNVTSDLARQKQDICQYIGQTTKERTAPIEVNLPDQDGYKWKIRFHFGFTRTSYAHTNMHFNSSRVNVTIKDFEFEERTSGEYYNPKNWTSLSKAFKWIDEPTNTFSLSFERKNDAIYLTVFHPKYLKKEFQEKYVVGTVDGVEVNEKMPINATPSADGQTGDMYLASFQNTFGQVDWQIGYGRRFTIYEGKKLGKLSYVARADFGMTSTRNKTVYRNADTKTLEEYDDAVRIAGMNASLGHRLEYQKGRLGVFVDQKLTYSRLKHGFLDGKATYNMLYSPVTFGVSLDLYRKKVKAP